MIEKYLNSQKLIQTMNEKALYKLISLVILGAIIAIPLLIKNNSLQPISNGINYHGEVCVWINEELVGCNRNLIVNSGKDLVYYALTGTTVNVNQMAVANRTTPLNPSDTSLQGEWTTCGLARGTVDTIVRNGYGNWTLSKLWTITCDNVIINATALYASDNTLFAEATIPTHTLYESEQLRISWTIWVS